jgi:large subunit ribosomal protein L23
MNIEKARRIIINSYITEKAYLLIDKDNKITFIVSKESTKPEIKEAIKLLYGVDVKDVNTVRTAYGKKAFVKFSSPGAARDLATKLGLV